jgi:hypothetical protein
VGTWRADRATISEEGELKGKTVPWSQPYFMRFYDDGTLTTWPPLKQIPRMPYELRDGQLLLTFPGDRTVSMKFGVSPDEMWYSSMEGNTLFFRRVTPDLEPGHFP